MLLRKFACVAVLLVLGVGLVMAEEFGVNIQKVDGNKITAIKGKKKDQPGTEVTLTATDDVKVFKGKFNQDTKKLEKGDAIADGLKAEVFTKIDEKKGLNVRVTTNDDGKVTEIVVGGGKKKKDAN
jgi:hypothetical protein